MNRFIVALAALALGTHVSYAGLVLTATKTGTQEVTANPIGGDNQTRSFDVYTIRLTDFNDVGQADKANENINWSPGVVSGRYEWFHFSDQCPS